MAEIRAHIPMAKKWWTGGETVRKRSSQTIGKTTPSSIDPFDEKGHARISAACNCPYVFTVLSPRLHLSLSLSWIARSIAARTSGSDSPARRSSIYDLPGRGEPQRINRWKAFPPPVRVGLGQELCESCSCGDSKPVELWEGRGGLRFRADRWEDRRFLFERILGNLDFFFEKKRKSPCCTEIFFHLNLRKLVYFNQWGCKKKHKNSH